MTALKPRKESEATILMRVHLRELDAEPDGGFELHEEQPFHPTRKWRFDFAIVRAWNCAFRLLGIEIEGASWVAGRHTRGKGFEDDCEKYAEAAILGWTVLRFTTAQVLDGRAKELVRRWLAARGEA